MACLTWKSTDRGGNSFYLNGAATKTRLLRCSNSRLLIAPVRRTHFVIHIQSFFTMTHKDLTINRKHIPCPSAEEEKLEGRGVRKTERLMRKVSVVVTSTLSGQTERASSPPPSKKHTSILCFLSWLQSNPLFCFSRAGERKLRRNASSGSGSRRVSLLHRCWS